MEEYKKVNNYILSVIFNEEIEQHRVQTCKKIFNFMSRQITTIYSDAIFQRHEFSYEKSYSSQGGIGGGASATSAIAQSLIQENFCDLSSADEVKLMHIKLLELGGTPPSIEKVLGKIDKPRNTVQRPLS